MLIAAAETCVLVDGARLRAADLATAVPAFATLPPDHDLGPAPAGTLVRVFTRAQLATFFPGRDAQLPDRLCLRRKREAIAAEAWQSAIDLALTEMCGATPWRAKVQDSPRHKFPTGKLVFSRSGLTASRGLVQVWRGAVVLPDKSSVPVWVRVEFQTRRRAPILNRSVSAGAIFSADDFRGEDIWAPGACGVNSELLDPTGLVAKRALPVGAELRKEDLRHPPAIQRGQAVELEAVSGPARLRVPAIAEHDADLGGTVQLKSKWNGSKLVGRVTGAQKAKVD